MNKKNWKHHLKTQIWKFGIILEITTRTSYSCHKTKAFTKIELESYEKKKMVPLNCFTKSPYSGG
jgi:hypothetical protein